MLQNDLCLKYLEYFSDNRDVSAPLFILLHGRAANEVDLFDLAPKISKNCISLSVRAPIEMGKDSYGWFHTSYLNDGTPVYDPAEAERSKIELIQFIKDAQAKYHSSPNETYLIGFSQGSIMALGIALERPEIISGVAALSGRILSEHLPPKAATMALKNFPILISHGTEDDVLNIEYARSARKILEKLSIDLSYYEYPMGHDVTDMNFTEVQNWIELQLADKSPK